MAHREQGRTPFAAIASVGGGTSREEIETALDGVVGRIIKNWSSRKAIPGWQILFSMGLSFQEVGSACVPTLNDEQATKLVKLAETNPHAFDGAAYVAGMQFVVDHMPDAPYCPLTLRVFGGQFLVGEIERPPQPGRPRVDDIPLRLLKLVLCWTVAKRAPLPLARGSHASGAAAFSACDAVAEAFTRAGHPESWSQLASLCNHKQHRQLRELAEIRGLFDFIK